MHLLLYVPETYKMLVGVKLAGLVVLAMEARSRATMLLVVPMVHSFLVSIA